MFGVRYSYFFCGYKHLNTPRIRCILMDTRKYDLTKTVRITLDIHERIDNLRGKDETYNTVIARGISALEAKLRTEKE